MLLYERFAPDDIIFMFTLSSRVSLQGIERFIDNIFSRTKQVPFVLIGSKADEWDKNTLTKEDVTNLQKKLSLIQQKIGIPHVPYLSISSKTGENVENVFPTLIELLGDLKVI